MNLSSLPFRQEIERWYAARAPREQTILRASMILVPLLILYLAVWQPLASSRAELQKRLPGLREAALRFAAEADEFERLRERAPGRGAARAARAAVEDTAGRMSITLQGIESTGADRTVVQLASVPFDALTRWLGELGASEGLLVETIQMTSAGDGQVKVDRLVLVPASRRATQTADRRG